MSFLKRDKSKLNILLGSSQSSAGQHSDNANNHNLSKVHLNSSFLLQNHPEIHVPPRAATSVHSVPASPAAVQRVPSQVLVEPRVDPPVRLAIDDPEPLPTNTRFGSGIPHRNMHRAQSASASLLPSSSMLDPNETLTPEIQGSSSHVTAQPRPLTSRSLTEDFLPRLLMVLLSPAAHGLHTSTSPPDDGVLKEDYKGFHRNKAGIFGNVPPLSQPIKPRFRKKGHGLLGKLIHLNRKDLDGSVELTDASDVQLVASSHPTHTLSVAMSPQVNRRSTSSQASKHKFRLPSISLHHHHHGQSTSTLGIDSRNPSILEEGNYVLDKGSDKLSNPLSKQPSFSGPAGSPSKVFDLDLNFEEMGLILKKPPRASTRPSLQLVSSRTSANDVSSTPEAPPPTEDHHKHSAWRAPDSWDVTGEDPSAIAAAEAAAAAAVSASDSETDKEEENEKTHNLGYALLVNSSRSSVDVVDGTTTPAAGNDKKQKKKTDKVESEPLPFRKNGLPILFGTISTRNSLVSDSKLAKGPNHIIRVFKEDNTFTTILCPLETTTAELLTIVQRKFFFESISNYQISLYVGSNIKVLEPFEKPLKIQMGLLTLSGYTEKDNLRIIGREDMSSVCKFVVENMFLRNLTHEEESLLSKDYVDVNISSLDLKTIPIIFHQHTYEIEKLNVADNPSIYIPLDFIQSCTNLSSINFARNGCSKFPVNFLHATSLTYLNMEANFLDELPSKFSHLKMLKTLKLNSNQLYFLPKTFGRLSNLTDLNLSSNYFQVYPECINELTNLQDLNLSYNDLSEIPESISKLTKLTKLNLSTNKLSKNLPTCFKSLTNLKRLDIRYNGITNVDVLGSLPNLEVVYASKNNISGFSDKMESLRLLHFDRNPITNLEFEILLPMLTVLDLSKAKITALPAEFITKIPHIEKLVLDKNHLVTLPSELCNLPKLTHLSLYGNNIQHLPEDIGRITSLQYLDLHSNNLESLPADIWNLKNLSTLNVSSNILASFPKPLFAVAKKITSYANLKNPMVDSLEKANEVSASAIKNSPVSLADSLLSLTLSDNRFSDESFEAIAFFLNLKVLNMAYNDIIEIPDGALGRLTKLSELYLSGNNLTKLPAEDFENITDLRLLYLNNNKLTTLPSELSKLKNLVHLDVGSNQLRYNISNWPYDWNWHWNKKLKYLNFSGNKRFEIKQSYLKNPETGDDFDSLLVLKDLRVLGLIDVTLTTPAVPDLSIDMRVRTTSSELSNVGYGVSDTMGIRDYVSFRDMFIQKFRGNDNEVLVCSFDGHIIHHQTHGHLISFLSKHLFYTNFINELDKVKSDDEVEDAMRRAFLSLNKDINSVLAAKKSGNMQNTNISPELAELSTIDDALSGSSMSVIYVRGDTVYCGNVGDIEIVCAKNNGEYNLLSTKHDPTSRPEFERIRASGGYVSGNGALDGNLPISRGVGFFGYLPHTHSGPSMSSMHLSGSEDMIVMGSKILWDYVSYDLAVDILRQEKDDPMLAAQKLRDYAICYGATDKISVTVLSVGDQNLKKKKKLSSLYSNLGRETDLFSNKKRNRLAPSGDTALRRLDNEIEPPVGDLALVFTDIKNSTLLWDTYPVAMRSAIKLHNTIMRRQLRIVGGYEVKTEGDSFMVSFPTPTSALLWCLTIQNQLLNEDWPSEILETNECCEVTDSSGNIIYRGLSVRMGIHWGSPVCELDMVTRRMDYFGPMVNRASRIESSADGGQIAVSSDFLHEVELLYQMHDQIKSGSLTLEAAYEGNTRVGEIIEKEISSLESIGISYFELGQRKLKGLETPEMITLAFPKSLDIRYEIFQKQLQDLQTSGRIVGALPVEAVYQLRTISLRLENVCSMLNCGISNDEQFLRSSSDTILKSVGSNFVEQDFVGLFNHIVTRVENCIALIELRQSLLMLQGNNGRLRNTKTLWSLIDEVNQLLGLIATTGKQ
ncbi:CIC11C00000002144 [Sungouiella intermedia]|uniref:Adenylate cyclase n=1 Tax=Sungouiella intermedia TaxID=45354 RepID=A0A1L0B986_9ASCO|nr:CIC11C00000002144 [[Candida] intermedia]